MDHLKDAAELLLEFMELFSTIIHAYSAKLKNGPKEPDDFFFEDLMDLYLVRLTREIFLFSNSKEDRDIDMHTESTMSNRHLFLQTHLVTLGCRQLNNLMVRFTTASWNVLFEVINGDSVFTDPVELSDICEYVSSHCLELQDLIEAQSIRAPRFSRF